MLVMGIETSCDETAVSIVSKNKNSFSGKVIKEIIYSQIKSHIPFGGIVPELSSREHIKKLDKITRKALKDSKLIINDIDAFACTAGPGLLGGLLIGSNYTKAICLGLNKPFFAINHLEAHILVSRLSRKISFPFLVLLISGGHTQLLIVKGTDKFILLGETLDDAIGEAFDKTAKLMGKDYPGGPEIEKMAKKSNYKGAYKLPRPLINKKNFDFSFSGLKTAVRIILKKKLSALEKNNLAQDFQQAILDCLLDKCGNAMDEFKKNYGTGYFVVSGGVASNFFLRKGLKTLSKKKNMRFFAPDPKLCVDNATMVAWAAIEQIISGKKHGDPINFDPRPRWPLNEFIK